MFDYTDKYGPQQVGGRYFCAYWRKEYTVTALDPDGFISIKWEDGRTGRHLTPWDHGRDRVIRQPLDKRVARMALISVAGFKTSDSIMLWERSGKYQAALIRARAWLASDNPEMQKVIARHLAPYGL